MTEPSKHRDLRISGCEVTVVVPTRNAARTLRTCLKSLRAQQQDCTVVVVDNASSDDTLSIAGELADLVLSAGPERSAQRNAGAAATESPIVGFIDADMAVSPGVVSEAAAAIRAGAGAVTVPEHSRGEGFWARVRAFEREFYNGHDSLEAARFYRRDVLDVTGGFDEELTGAEDWDLTIRARRLAPVVRISQWIDHEEGALTYLDACRKKAYYAEGLRRFAIKHGPMALGTRMRRPWMGKPGRLVSPLGLGLIALKAGETIAVTNAIVRKRSGARPVGGAEG